MAKAVISVVIPAFNSAGFIAKTIDCLRLQTFKFFELVVIDDGSSDDTYKFISDYIGSNLNFPARLIGQKNKGIAGARNSGILEAQGDFIAFLDHDDLWYPEKLSKCYAFFSGNHSIDLVCHDELLRMPQGKSRLLSYGPCADDMFRRLLFKGNCLSTSAIVARRNILLEAGLFREGPDFLTTEDYDLWLRLSKKYKFYFLKEVLGEYVINSNNASLNLERHYNNQITVIKSNFASFRQKKPFDYWLVKIRITKFYLMIAKYLFFKSELKNTFKYLSKALVNLFCAKLETA